MGLPHVAHFVNDLEFGSVSLTPKQYCSYMMRDGEDALAHGAICGRLPAEAAGGLLRPWD